MNSMDNRLSRLFRRPVKAAFLVAIVAAAALAGAGCGDNGSTSAFDIGTGPVTVKAKDPISREAVETIVTHKLGDAGIQGQPVIRSVTLTPEGTGTFVSIDLNRTSSCHPGALVGTAVNMGQQVMSAVFRYPDVSKVQLTLYGITEEAKDKDTQAVKIMVTKDAANKIDWFQFKEETVGTLASEYWIEPSVLVNYQTYGSAAILDEALRQAANGGVATPAPTATTPAS